MARGAGKVALLVSVLVLFVSGCTTEQTTPSGSSDEPSTSASPSSTSDEQAVTDVYKKYFETVQALGSADEAKIRADLAPYAEGPAIENVVIAMESLRSQNQQPAGSVVFAALEIMVKGDTAIVRECHDGTTELLVDSTTGAVISHGPLSGQRAEVVRTNGTWRVGSHAGDETACR